LTDFFDEFGIVPRAWEQTKADSYWSYVGKAFEAIVAKSIEEPANGVAFETGVAEHPTVIPDHVANASYEWYTGPAGNQTRHERTFNQLRWIETTITQDISANRIPNRAEILALARIVEHYRKNPPRPESLHGEFLFITTTDSIVASNLIQLATEKRVQLFQAYIEYECRDNPRRVQLRVGKARKLNSVDGADHTWHLPSTPVTLEKVVRP
jgi:hypothetical protein